MKEVSQLIKEVGVVPRSYTFVTIFFYLVFLLGICGAIMYVLFRWSVQYA